MNSRGFSLSRAAAILGVSFIGGTVCAVILTLGHSPETKPATFFGLDPSADSPRSARGSFTQTSFSSLRNVVTSNWPTRAATGHLRNLLGWSSGRGEAIAPRLEDHRSLSVAAHAVPPPAEYPAPGSGTLSGPLAGQAAQPGYQLLELPKELGVLPQPDTPPAAMPLVAPSQGPETLARFSLPDSPRDARQPDAVLTAGTTPEPVAAQQPDKPAGQSPSASPDPAVSEPAVPIVGSGERMEMASPESLRALVERVQPDPGGSPGRVVDEPKPSSATTRTEEASQPGQQLPRPGAPQTVENAPSAVAQEAPLAAASQLLQKVIDARSNSGRGSADGNDDSPVLEPIPEISRDQVVRQSDPAIAPAPAGISRSPDPALGAAPLPGQPWIDPDAENWSEAVAAWPAAQRPDYAAGRTPRERIVGRISDRQPPAATPTTEQAPTGASPAPAAVPGRAMPEPPAAEASNLFRLRDRVRQGEGIIGRLRNHAESGPPSQGQTTREPSEAAWPQWLALERQLGSLVSSSSSPAEAAVGRWANDTLAVLRRLEDTRGPQDPAAGPILLDLGESVHAGIAVAEGIADAALASSTRRAALAASRRASVWRAAAAIEVEGARVVEVTDEPGGPASSSRSPLSQARIRDEVSRMLVALERFETEPTAAEALAVRLGLGRIDMPDSPPVRALTRAVEEHYQAPNVRIDMHQQFLERLLPDAVTQTSPVRDVILGRPVHGKRTVERSTTIRMVPDADEICFDLEVRGEIVTQTVTATGPVSLTSRGTGSFTVRKPLKLTTAGLLFGPSVAQAQNRSQLAHVQTSFDSVPVVGSLVRAIARNQHDENLPDANREVTQRIIGRSCREVDEQAEPQFSALAERVRQRVWEPIVQLGLEPHPIMETSADRATLRLRLAGDTQLAAHTPRPRAPLGALLGVQVHESCFNNAFNRLGMAGSSLPLKDLLLQVQAKLGLDPQLPEDLPEDVRVAFARHEPLRIDCRDGLVHVAVTLDALESGRRNWYDVIARVAYKPVAVGPQVFLEREGPVQIGGSGHRGRLEIGLRTIFGKIFPKERPIPVLPAKITTNPRLADTQAIQAVACDGWFALALAARSAPPPDHATASRPGVEAARR